MFYQEILPEMKKAGKGMSIKIWHELVADSGCQ